MDVISTFGDRGARVVGTMTRAITAGSVGARGVVGVRFRPGAIDLLGASARELRDAAAPVADVWGARGRSFDAHIVEASDTRSALRVLAGEIRRRSGPAAFGGGLRVARRPRRVADSRAGEAGRPRGAPARTAVRGTRGLRAEVPRPRGPDGAGHARRRRGARFDRLVGAA